MHSRKQYLEEVRKEYGKGTKAEKGQLLDEAQRRTKLSRKYLIRKLNRSQESPPRRRRKRKTHYGAEVVTAMVRTWEIFDYPCGQRLAPLLKTEVARLRQKSELRCSEPVAELLQTVSAKTIDRLLQREKRERGLRKARNPSLRGLLYERIPVKVAADWDTNELGNVQVDFVAHCGRSTGGQYIHTLSSVDIATNWWEGQAIAARSQLATKEGMEQIRLRFPFRIREVHPDNDSALVNDLLWDWCRAAKIRLSRSRPYKKNDNAWIEQKNWTHVRKMVGYRRYDNTVELQLLNQIYAVSRLYKNFFQPTIKLASKQRVHGRIKRVYEPARTPYARLMASRHIRKSVKAQLKTVYNGLNPAELKRQLESLQNELRKVSHLKGDVVYRPSYRGPDIWISKWRGRMRRTG